MIAFATAIREPDAYDEQAGPGIRLAAEPDSEVFAFAAIGSACRSYNLVLDRVADREDLEALVLVDEDAEIADPDFCAKVRAALTDPDVALVGCIGATAIEGPAWWEGAVSAGDVVHRYRDFGGGETTAFAWARTGGAPATVDTVAGFLLVLSPWAARSLRFEEALPLAVGFELDLAARVREAGRKVMTIDVRVRYHRPLEFVEDLDLWAEGHIHLAEHWDGRVPGTRPRPADWKQRARLAEAERDAARAQAYSEYSRREAQLVGLERRLEAMTTTLGWRLTKPLRRLNAARRRARGGSPRAR